jgi:hypothetical protein
MKDLHTVLLEKEQDIERVRREIQALLAAIPLLEDGQHASDEVMDPLRAVSPPSGRGTLRQWHG